MSTKNPFETQEGEEVPITDKVSMHGETHEKDLARRIEEEHGCTTEDAIDYIHRAEERGDIDRKRPGADKLVPDTPGVTAGELAAGPVTVLIKLVKAFVWNFVSAITKVLPVGDTFWRRMVYVGFNKLYRSTDADAIGMNVGDNGYVEPIPIKYGVDEDDQEAWVSKDGERKWHPSKKGHELLQFGSGKIRTPVVIMGDEPTTTNPLELHLTEALEWPDRRRPILKDVEIEEQYVQVIDDPAEASGEADAVADGGPNAQVKDQWKRNGVNVRDWGEEHDVAVDSGVPPGFNGQAWSVRNYAELTLEKVSSEEMQRQFDLGKITEKDEDAMRSFAIKMMLIAGAIVVGVVFLLVFFGGGSAGSAIGMGLPLAGARSIVEKVRGLR